MQDVEREISQLVVVTLLNMVSRCHTAVAVMKGNENQTEGRDQISQSHRAAVKVSTFYIVNHSCSRSVDVFHQSWSWYWGRSGNYCWTIFVL